MRLRPHRTDLFLAALIAVVLVSAWVCGSGDPLGSVEAILDAAMPVFPLCLGAALVISVGEIDLSVAGSYSFFGMVLLSLASVGVPPAVSLLIVLGLALGIGWSLGYLVVEREVPSLVASLAAAMVLLGIAAAIEYRMQVRGAYLTLARQDLLPVFRYALAWAVVLVIAAERWRRSLPGIRHVAVGMDRQAALLAAIPMGQVRRRAFLSSSLLSCVACMLVITGFQEGGWDAEAGKGLELVAIAVAVIGGTRVSGGVFRPVGAFLGIILWESLDHLRFLANIGIAYQELLGGLVLLGVVAASGARLRSRPRQPGAAR